MLMLSALLAAVAVRGESFVTLPTLKPCCTEKTAICEACLANTTPVEFCEENPLEKTCYAAPGAECASTRFERATLQFPFECDSNHECTRNAHLPNLPGRCTPVLRKLGEECGSCFCPPLFNAGSCEEGLHCITNPALPDLPGKCAAGKCCSANTAKCVACRFGFTVEQWCAAGPKFLGCPGGEKCCNEFTAECRACKGNLSIAEFCGFESNRAFPGCEKKSSFFFKERLEG